MTPGRIPEPSTGDGRIPASAFAFTENGKLSRGPTTLPEDSHCPGYSSAPFNERFQFRRRHCGRSERGGSGSHAAGVGRIVAGFETEPICPVSWNRFPIMAEHRRSMFAMMSLLCRR